MCENLQEFVGNGTGVNNKMNIQHADLVGYTSHKRIHCECEHMCFSYNDRTRLL